MMIVHAASVQMYSAERTFVFATTAFCPGGTIEAPRVLLGHKLYAQEVAQEVQKTKRACTQLLAWQGLRAQLIFGGSILQGCP